MGFTALETTPAAEDLLSTKEQPQAQQFRRSILVRILLPYLLVVLTTAVIGTFVIVRLVSGYLDQQVVNQLVNSIRETNNAMAALEERQLESFRSIAFTEGLDEAIAQNVMPFIHPTIWRLQIIHQVPYVELLNIRGQQLMSTELHERTVEDLSGEPGIQGWQIVQNVLQRKEDERGDIWAALMATSERGYVLYTAGPVRNPTRENTTTTGVLLVGTALDSLIVRLTQQMQVGITVYDPQTGAVLGTSLPYNHREEAIVLTEAQIAQVPEIQASEGQAIRRKLEIGTARFDELISTLNVRGVPTAVVGISIPLEPIEQMRYFFRDRFILLISVVTLVLLLIGALLARGIIGRIKTLDLALEHVAAGNLDYQVTDTGHDELSGLASTYNRMVERLRRRASGDNG